MSTNKHNCNSHWQEKLRLKWLHVPLKNPALSNNPKRISFELIHISTKCHNASIISSFRRQFQRLHTKQEALLTSHGPHLSPTLSLAINKTETKKQQVRTETTAMFRLSLSFETVGRPCVRACGRATEPSWKRYWRQLITPHAGCSWWPRPA
jgi:hypothetical protein